MIRLIVFVILMSYALIGAFRSPFGGLLAYIWFGLFRPQEWVWFDISGLKLSLVLGLLLIGRSITKGIWPNVTHKLSIGMLLFLATGLLAQVDAVRPDIGWHWIDFFTRLVLVCLLLVSLVDTTRRYLYTVMVICTSIGYYTAKAGLISLVAGGTRFGDGLAGAYVDNNGYALAAVMVVPMMLAVADNIPAEWRWRKHIVLSYRLAVPLTLYAAISTFSRGGLLAIVAGGFVFVLLQARRRLGTVLLIGLAGLIVLPFVPMPKGYEERMQTIVTYQQAGETSAISRLHFWKVAVDMVIDKPLGVGMYNFNSTYDQYDFLHGQFGTERSVHSSHFEALAENGFFGFAVWIGLFIMAIRSCLRVRKLAMTRLQGTPEGTFFWTMGGAMIISMVAFLVGGSFIALTLNDLTWITFGLVAALETICLKTVSERAGEPVGRGVRRGPVRPVRPRPVRTPPPLPSPRRTTQQRPEHVSRPPP